jgi:hypothetical protein
MEASRRLITSEFVGALKSGFMGSSPNPRAASGIPAGLTWRPCQGPTAEQMDVEMRDRFAAIGPVINDEAEAGVMEAFLLRDGLRDDEEVAEQFLVLSGSDRDTGNFPLRNDKDVDGRLGMGVVKRNAGFVLVDNPGGDFPGDDAGEDRTHRISDRRWPQADGRPR